MAAWVEHERQASQAAAPVLPWGMLLCSGPPSPCLHLGLCKELTGQIVHFALTVVSQEKARQTWVPAAQRCALGCSGACSREQLWYCQHMVSPCRAEPPPQLLPQDSHQVFQGPAACVTYSEVLPCLSTKGQGPVGTGHCYPKTWAGSTSGQGLSAVWSSAMLPCCSLQ